MLNNYLLTKNDIRNRITSEIDEYIKTYMPEIDDNENMIELSDSTNVKILIKNIIKDIKKYTGMRPINKKYNHLIDKKYVYYYNIKKNYILNIDLLEFYKEQRAFILFPSAVCDIVNKKEIFVGFINRHLLRNFREEPLSGFNILKMNYKIKSFQNLVIGMHFKDIYEIRYIENQLKQLKCFQNITKIDIYIKWKNLNIIFFCKLLEHISHNIAVNLKQMQHIVIYNLARGDRESFRSDWYHVDKTDEKRTTNCDEYYALDLVTNKFGKLLNNLKSFRYATKVCVDIPENKTIKIAKIQRRMNNYNYKFTMDRSYDNKQIGLLHMIAG